MLRVYSKNEKELAVILGNMKDCRVVSEDSALKVEPMVKLPGTCSSCPHFESRRDEGRGAYVKWGTCLKVGGNVNEHRKQCSLYKNELEGKEEEVEKAEKRDAANVYVA